MSAAPAGMTGVFSIGIDRRFADELARGVLAEQGDDPLALADMLILVPTRRAVRALREAFLRAADGKPTLLPNMAPLGDLHDGDLDGSDWDVASGDSAALTLPPAIEPAERDALLAGLVALFRDDRGQPIAQSAAQALKLARELARLLDELAIDSVPFEKLEALVEEPLAAHLAFPRHRRRALASHPGRPRPDRCTRPPHASPAPAGGAVARDAAREPDHRGWIDRLAAGNP